MPKRKLIPDVVNDQELVCVTTSTTVRDAVKLMADRRVAAVMVAEGRALRGIFTERDVTVRVVAMGRDADTTKVAEVMTANPDVLGPDASALEALDLMETHRYRHLPVVADDGAILGMVSIRDLFGVVRAHLEDEIKTREAFMFGSSYSAGASA